MKKKQRPGRQSELCMSKGYELGNDVGRVNFEVMQKKAKEANGANPGQRPMRLALNAQNNNQMKYLRKNATQL